MTKSSASNRNQRHRESQQRWKVANPERVRELARNSYHKNVEKIRVKEKLRYHSNPVFYRQRALASRYGVTIEQLQALQTAPCGICGSTDDTQVDHCHKCLGCGFYNRNRNWARECERCGTKLRVRGTLCRRHNSFTGFLDTSSREELKRVFQWVGLNGGIVD